MRRRIVPRMGAAAARARSAPKSDRARTGAIANAGAGTDVDAGAFAGTDVRGRCTREYRRQAHLCRLTQPPSMAPPAPVLPVSMGPWMPQRAHPQRSLPARGPWGKNFETAAVAGCGRRTTLSGGAVGHGSRKRAGQHGAYSHTTKGGSRIRQKSTRSLGRHSVTLSIRVRRFCALSCNSFAPAIKASTRGSRRGRRGSCSGG